MEDRKYSGRPSTCTALEMIAKVREVFLEDIRQTIHDVCNRVGLSYGSCQCILTDELNMRRIAAKSLEQWPARPSGSGVHRAAKNS